MTYYTHEQLHADNVATQAQVADALAAVVASQAQLEALLAQRADDRVLLDAMSTLLANIGEQIPDLINSIGAVQHQLIPYIPGDGEDGSGPPG